MRHETLTGDIIRLFEQALKHNPETTYIMTLTDTSMRSFKGSKIDRAWGILEEMGKEAADALGVRGSFTHTVMSMAGEVTATKGHPRVLMAACNDSYYGVEKAFRGVANYIFMKHDPLFDDDFRMPMVTVFVGGLGADLRKAMFDALYPIDWIQIVEVFEKEDVL